MSITHKLQSLPEKQKKIILWIIVIITAVFLLRFYIQNMQDKIKEIQGERISEGLQIQKLQEQLEETLKDQKKQLEESELGEKLEELLESEIPEI